MGYQEPVLELPVVNLFNSPSLRPQNLVAPRDVTEGVYEVLEKRSTSQDGLLAFAALDLTGLYDYTHANMKVLTCPVLPCTTIAPLPRCVRAIRTR